MRFGRSASEGKNVRDAGSASPESQTIFGWPLFLLRLHHSTGMTAINDVAALLPTLLAPLESLKLPSPTALPSSSHSLLALKPSLLHEYTQGLLLLHSHRLRGLPIDSGEGAELVKALISIRLCLEKARPLEAKARAGIERLLRAAEQQEREGGPSAAQQADEDAQDQGE